MVEYCSYPGAGCPGWPEMPLLMGRLGERVPGVLGPLDEAAEVKDDWEPVLLATEEMELTRGDELLDE